MSFSVDTDLERFSSTRKELEIDKLFRAVVKLEGSDLHLKVDCPPYVRVTGSLRPLNRPRGRHRRDGAADLCDVQRAQRGGSSTRTAGSTSPTRSRSTG